MYGGGELPERFLDFRLMKLLGVTPTELDSLEFSDLEMYAGFINLEHEQQRIENKRAEQRHRQQLLMEENK